MQKVNRFIAKRYLHQGRVSKINISPLAFNVLRPQRNSVVNYDYQPLFVEKEVVNEKPIIEEVVESKEDIVETTNELVVKDDAFNETEKVSTYSKRKKSKKNKK